MRPRACRTGGRSSASTGFARIEDVERLAGLELRVPEEALQPLAEARYYQHQLVGCAVETTGGERGRDVAGGRRRWRQPAGRRRRRGEMLVPLAADICVEIDVGAKRIRIEPPEGLLELNETARSGQRQWAVGSNDTVRNCRLPTVTPTMKFDIVTIFPRMVEAGLAEGVVSRGIERGLLDVAVHDLRDYTTDRHRSVDDVPYGGGPGMVMKPEPLARAVEDIRARRGDAGRGGAAVAAGPAVHAGRGGADRAAWGMWCCCAADTRGWTSGCAALVATEELSIGDYVLSGGELPALVVVDAVSRLVPGVVGDEQSVEEDSFSRGLLDYPHYTRPAEFAGLRGAGRAAVGASRARSGGGGRRRRWRERWSAGRSCWNTRRSTTKSARCSTRFGRGNVERDDEETNNERD